MQLIKMKQDIPVLNLILLGGAGAHLVCLSSALLSAYAS